MLIKGFDSKLLNEGGVYIVALSGGMDSICLMENVMELAKMKRIIYYAIHINHHIRGEEADRDEDFVRSYVKRNHIMCAFADVDTINFAKDMHLSTEEAARTLRYSVFEKTVSIVSKRLNHPAHLLVAHHESDQAETVVHNMLRGSGIAGIRGMEDTSDYIVRPMLHCSKRDIIEYVHNNSIPYVEDSTNQDVNYTRNYIRNIIFPEYEKINNRAIEHICDVANDATEANNFLTSLAEQDLEKILIGVNAKECEIYINNTVFAELEHIMKIYSIRNILDLFDVPLKDITRKHLEDIIDMSMKEKGGHLDLPYNITIDKKKSKLIIKRHLQNFSMSKRKKI